MEVLGSALKHSVDPDDIDHALQHALVIEEVGEDPSRYLVLGPDRSANLLELVVLDRPAGPAVITQCRCVRSTNDFYRHQGGDPHRQASEETLTT